MIKDYRNLSIKVIVVSEYALLILALMINSFMIGDNKYNIIKLMMCAVFVLLSLETYISNEVNIRFFTIKKSDNAVLYYLVLLTFTLISIMFIAFMYIK
jgi:hypothetical protein